MIASRRYDTTFIVFVLQFHCAFNQFQSHSTCLSLKTNGDKWSAKFLTAQVPRILLVSSVLVFSILFTVKLNFKKVILA